MPPKGKAKVPEAPVSLLPGPFDGSVAIDFTAVLEALACEELDKHQAVTEAIKGLPRLENVQVCRPLLRAVLEQLLTDSPSLSTG